MDAKPNFTNPFKAHYALMQQIVGKVVNDTFFGLCCVVCVALARWVFPVNTFFRGCSICLALIFGVAFYLTTIFRVARNSSSKPAWKGFWLGVVILVPIVGGLLYYYLRLLFEYLPSGTRNRLEKFTQKPFPAPAEEPYYESEPGSSTLSDSGDSVNFSPAVEGISPL
jgi:hypothetical protein